MFDSYVAGNPVLPQHHPLLKPKLSIKIQHTKFGPIPAEAGEGFPSPWGRNMEI